MNRDEETVSIIQEIMGWICDEDKRELLVSVYEIRVVIKEQIKTLSIPVRETVCGEFATDSFIIGNLEIFCKKVKEDAERSPDGKRKKFLNEMTSFLEERIRERKQNEEE